MNTDSLLAQITEDHVMTSIKVCPFLDNRNVFGIQVGYGIWSESGLIDEILLTPHGLTESEAVACQTIDLLNDEFITALSVGYTDIDLVFLGYSTSSGLTETYGQFTDNLEFQIILSNEE